MYMYVMHARAGARGRARRPVRESRLADLDGDDAALLLVCALLCTQTIG